MKIRDLTIGVAVMVAAIATVTVYRSERASIRSTAEQTFEVRADLIHQYVGLMRHNVDALQHAIESRYKQVQRSGAIAPEVSAIRYYPKDGVWGVSGLESEGGIAQLSGTLTGSKALRDPAKAVSEELTAVFDNDDQFHILLKDVPDIIWVYYTSSNDFIYIAPDPAIADFRFSKVLMTKEFWVQAAPRNNPDLKQIITDLYDDYYGQGLMISISSPVVLDGDFRGVASLDLGIALLRSLTGVGSAAGESILVDEHNRIVARVGKFDLSEEYDVPRSDGWIQDIMGADWLSTDVAAGELRLLHRLPEAELRWASIRAGGLYWAVFAAMLGLVMFSVRLNEALSKVRFLMNRDTLTDLLNRRGFAASVAPRREVARRDGRRTALLLMDIDHFKRVNDSYGHDMGDQVLSGIAQRLSVGVMEYDLVCRWGGEELLVFLVYEDPGTLWRIAQRLRTSIGNRVLSDEGLSVTVSGGLTDWGWDEPLEPAVDRADQLMYEAKAAGRNQIKSDIAGAS